MPCFQAHAYWSPVIKVGQSPFFALNLTYKPKHIVKTVSWDALQAEIVYNLDNWGNLSAAGTNVLQERGDLKNTAALHTIDLVSRKSHNFAMHLKKYGKYIQI